MLAGAGLLGPAQGRAADPVPMIDAHSQADRELSVARLLKLMDRGGVRHTILSSRGGLPPQELVAMAAAHPDRITASMEVKSHRHYLPGTPEFFRRLEEMGKEPRYGAISEALLWHQAKGGQRRGGGRGAGEGQRGRGRGSGEAAQRGGRSRGGGGGDEVAEFDLPIDAPQVQAVLKMALARNWPFIAHYEFRSLSKERYDARMKELKDLLRTYPDHPIVLIHMGQLRADEAAQLIAEFRNIHFMTSHANPVFEAVGGGFGWTRLFEGRRLAPAWKALFVANPDRFILPFDNVLKRHWEAQYYLAQARLWQGHWRICQPTWRMRSRTAMPSGFGVCRRYRYATVPGAPVCMLTVMPGPRATSRESVAEGHERVGRRARSAAQKRQRHTQNRLNGC